MPEMHDEMRDAGHLDTSRLANKYRRAFKWRVSRGGDGIESGVAGAVHLATSDYPEILEDYLYVSRKRRNNKTAISKLQLQMLNDILVQERSIKHYKEKLSADSDVSAPAAQNFIKSQVFAHGLISNTIRQIGDGIAWRSFGYDRFTQRVLCSHPVKQTVLAEGTVAELDEWSSINDEQGRMAVFNALTNCIGIGDITAVDANGDVELIEVKSGKGKGGRLVRQKNRLKHAAGILNTGTGVVEGKSITSGSLPIVPKNYLAELNTMLQQAGDDGWSSGLLAPHCHVECIDLKKLGKHDQVAPKLDEAYRRHTVKWNQDLASRGCSLDAINFIPNVAPFSIFPFDDRTCIELATGAKFFTSHINAAEVIRQFEASGWLVECALDEAIEKTKGEAVLIVTKGGFFCHIPPGDFAKLQFEMLDPSTLIDECELISGSDPKIAGGYGVWTYAGEAAQWN